jgi:hypothetical protein
MSPAPVICGTGCSRSGPTRGRRQKVSGPANKANEDFSAVRFCTRLSPRQGLGTVNATLQMVQKRLEKKLDFNRLWDFQLFHQRTIHIV